MYANYYLRRFTDHPNPPKRNKVVPERSISTQSVCDENSYRAVIKSPRDVVKAKEGEKPIKVTKVPSEKTFYGGERRHTLKGIATAIVNAIRFERAASFKTHGWKREVHGGLKMWVNQETGEVSTDKPWKLDFGMIRETIQEKSSPETKKPKKKRLSLTQRLSIIFFGNQEKTDGNSSVIPDDIKTKGKEYSDNSTMNITRQSSSLNDSNDNNDLYDDKENLSSELFELFQLFDNEKNKKKVILL